MSKVSIKSNTILWEIDRGTSVRLVINKPDGWAMCDEIVMDFKSKKDINEFSMLRLSLISGMKIEGTRLIIPLSKEQTTALRGQTIFSDIKQRIGTEVLDPIPVQINMNQTVTKL